MPGLAPHRVVQLTRELMPAGAVATVDAGAHMSRRRRTGTRGARRMPDLERPRHHGVRAARGHRRPARPPRPARRVLHGRRRALMVAPELETVARLRLPIMIVVFNDGAPSLIQVKQEQKGNVGTAMRYAGPDLPRSRAPSGSGRSPPPTRPGLSARSLGPGHPRAGADRRADRRLGLPPDARDRPGAPARPDGGWVGAAWGFRAELRVAK